MIDVDRFSQPHSQRGWGCQAGHDCSGVWVLIVHTVLGRSNDAQHNSATREEARFRKAEWTTTSATAPEAKRNTITDSSCI